MRPEIRTDIYPQAWNPCQRCWKPTLVYELSGMPNGVRTTRCYNFFGFQVAEYQTTEVVPVCPTCATQQIAAEQARRSRAVLAISGAGIVLFAWPYVGLFGLIPAAIITLLGGFFYRSRSNALVRRGNTQ